MQIRVKLASYSSVTDRTTISVVYGNKCLDPDSFSSVAQTGVTFTYGGANNFVLTPFTINPAECPIEYFVSSVKRKDDSTFTGDLTRTDFTNYNNFNNADKILSLSATSSNYLQDTIVPGRYLVKIAGSSYPGDKDY